jgi:hypothetical protein
LRKIGIEVNLPITVKTDNAGAMFMPQNALADVWTRHIDTRNLYIRENLAKGIINIKFVKFIESDYDIFTKNKSQEIYDKRVTKYWEYNYKE